jgi:hypothetical protein
MKLWHTSVIGLLLLAGCASAGTSGSSGGWNLLVPPITSAGNPALSEPLPKWQIVDNFSDLTDCQSYLSRLQFGVHGQYGPIANAQTPNQAQAVQLLNGQCVSITDPRLTGE